MFWLLENTSQLKQFYNKGYDEVFAEIIPFHDSVHPKLNKVSLVYIHPVKGRKGFIICIDHSETMSIDKSHILALFKTYKTVYTTDQKNFLYYFPINNLVDISFNAPEFREATTNAHTFFYTNHPSKLDVNRIIPVVKHYEKYENIYKQYKEYCYEQNKFYSKVSKVFYTIENNGININRKHFDKHFELPNNSFSINNSRIYTSYNLHTTTGRPSNAFNSINFAALSKDNGSRKSFTPRNDYFLEIDISAYHPTLAAQLISYPTHPEQIYAEFAKVAKVGIKEAKELMFRQLYGGIMDKYKFWDYFEQVQDYIDKLWNQYQTVGYINCPVSNYIFHKSKLENVNSNKLFNYVLQNLETSNNVKIIWDILKVLKGKNTKLVLYTYDAFLLDVDTDENLTEEIEQIFKKFNLHIKTKIGYNYDFK
jgi:hypothetical protein